MLALLLAGIGLISYQKLGRLEDPEYTIKIAVVFTQYPGATPQEVEEEVTDLIETAAQQLGQVDKVISRSTAGLSIVNVEIKDEYVAADLPQIWDELRRKINDIQGQLPPGAGPSIVNDDFGDVYGVFLAVTGDGYTYDELKDYVDILRRELLLVHDVAKVQIYGAQQEAVYVEMSRAKMSQLGISPQTIFNTLRDQNLVSSSGSVKVGSEYIRIDPTGGFASIDEIGELLIRDEQSDRLLHLKDVATVSHGYLDPPRNMLRFNGKPALGLGISTVSGGNVVEMGEALKIRLGELEEQTPVGIEIGTISYQSDDVTKAVDNFIINLAEALAIVIGLLMIFMGLRSGLIIGGILLMTVLSTFYLMDVKEIALQRISLGALIIALGMLVDNAIVVTEGILVRVQQGMERMKAAGEAVSTTMWPLLGATVVAIMAFAGIGLSQDSSGEFLGCLFWVILISLLVSWVLAVTITPLLCVMFLKTDNRHQGEDPYRGRIYQLYKRLLTFSLSHRLTISAIMVGLLALAFYGFGFVETSFFPASKKPQFMVEFWRTQGTHIQETSEDLQDIEQKVMELDGVKSVATFVGQGGLRFTLVYESEDVNTSYGQLLVTVADYRQIDSLGGEIMSYLQERFPDARTSIKNIRMGPGTSNIEVRFSGPDADVLRSLCNQVKTIMHGDEYSINVQDNWRQRVKVLRPEFSEVQARLVGISRPELSRALETAFSGTTVGIYREENDLMPIILRHPEDERLDVDNINNLTIWSYPARKSIPIGQIVSGFETQWEDPIIRRRDRMRTITASCETKEGNISVLLERLMPQIEQIEIPAGYIMEWGGEYESSNKANTMLGSKLPFTFLIMVLTVLALFNAFRQPIIIFLCLPLALIGVTAGLLTTGQPFGFMCLLGFISLSGMLIKNAVVLVDQIDADRRGGKEILPSIIDASVSRMRPVMMAAMTTVLGMLPLLFDVFFAGMAVTIMFGLTFGTVLTLLVVPVLYSIFFKAPRTIDG